MTSTAFVYVYGKPNEAGPVKIGHSKAPHRRTRELRHYPPSSILGGRNGIMLHILDMPSISASKSIECAVHALLGHRRVHGSINPYAHKHSSLLDWFHVTKAEAMEAIRQAAQAAGFDPAVKDQSVP